MLYGIPPESSNLRLVAKKDDTIHVFFQMQSNHQKGKSFVSKKTTREIPDGITITRRSKPPVDSITSKVRVPSWEPRRSASKQDGLAAAPAAATPLVPNSGVASEEARY